jgi:phage-related protein
MREAGTFRVIYVAKFENAVPVRRNIKKKVALVFHAGEAEITK